MRTAPTTPSRLAGRRIVVYGVTGSGKSTTAARLSGCTGIPWYAIDDYTWEPGWVAVPVEEQRRRVQRICAQESWILDSAYGSWLDVPMRRADLVVALDYPRWLSFGWLLRRSLTRILTREPICNGNVETWANTFADPESILRWHATSYPRKHQRIVEWMSRTDLPRVARFTRPAELDAWLRSLRPR